MNPTRPPVNFGRSAGTSIAGAWLLLALVGRVPGAEPAWADLEFRRPRVPDAVWPLVPRKGPMP